MALQVGTYNATAETDKPQFDESGKFAGSYLCVEEAAGGVKWDESRKIWAGVSFEVDNAAHLLLKITASGRKEWRAFGFDLSAMTYLAVVSGFGESDGVSCWGEREGYQPKDLVGYGHILMSPTGEFRCEAYGFHKSYKFNLGTLRYIETYLQGFIDGRDTGGETPAITIGKCARVD